MSLALRDQAMLTKIENKLVSNYWLTSQTAITDKYCCVTSLRWVEKITRSLISLIAVRTFVSADLTQVALKP